MAIISAIWGLRGDWSDLLSVENSGAVHFVAATAVAVGHPPELTISREPSGYGHLHGATAQKETQECLELTPLSDIADLKSWYMTEVVNPNGAYYQFHMPPRNGANIPRSLRQQATRITPHKTRQPKREIPPVKHTGRPLPVWEHFVVLKAYMPRLRSRYSDRVEYSRSANAFVEYYQNAADGVTRA